MTIRTLIYRLSLPLRLSKHAAIRKDRADAARRGHHTEIKRRAAKCRQMFG
jgi:hypothetical protein